MKIETLKKNNKKKWIIGSIVVITLIVTITFIGSRAKFKSTGSIPIAKGTIKYKYDMELVAIKLENENGTYDSSNNIPTSGYKLNIEKSICKVGEVKQDTTITYKNGKITIDGLTKKGTKCELYFDRFYTKDLILSHNTIDTSRATGPFNEPYNEDTSGKIFSAEDDDGTTYFFAGSNPNNWVKFGTNKEGQDLYWRIIRINGDNSIRVIYNGPTADQTGETTQIDTSLFNENYDDNKYIGYMYDSNETSSTIKDYIDSWYEENLKANFASYIDTNAGFCGDRTVDNYSSENAGNGTGITKTQYRANKSVYNTHIPTYACINKSNDLYTLSSSTKGNKALINPVGLITIDEVYYAGGYEWKQGLSYNYWIMTDQYFWTISPYYFDESVAYEFSVSRNGNLSYGTVNSKSGVRPVINLKADTLTTGNGTTTDPYRIA